MPQSVLKDTILIHFLVFFNSILIVLNSLDIFPSPYGDRRFQGLDFRDTLSYRYLFKTQIFFSSMVNGVSLIIIVTFSKTFATAGHFVPLEGDLYKFLVN